MIKNLSVVGGALFVMLGWTVAINCLASGSDSCNPLIWGDCCRHAGGWSPVAAFYIHTPNDTWETYPNVDIQSLPTYMVESQWHSHTPVSGFLGLACVASQKMQKRNTQELRIAFPNNYQYRSTAIFPTYFCESTDPKACASEFKKNGADFNGVVTP